MSTNLESVEPNSLRDRSRGVLLGLACGDALGRPVEFKTPAYISDEYGVIDEMVGYGTHNQPPGTVTDDTEMMLCIARSFVELSQFNLEDIASRYVDWYASGPFDIGRMTRDAIDELQRGASPKDAGKNVWRRRREGANAGNGSIMRCAPYALAYYDNPTCLANVSRASSRVTHYDKRCRDGCAALNAIIAGYLTGTEDVFEDALSVNPTKEVYDVIESIGDKCVRQSDLKNTGYVIHTLQTSLYDATTSTDAEEAINRSVNRGGDADTLGAVTGALVGARFGASALPKRWLDAINETDELIHLADALCVGDFETSE